MVSKRVERIPNRILRPEECRVPLCEEHAQRLIATLRVFEGVVLLESQVGPLDREFPLDLPSKLQRVNESLRHDTENLAQVASHLRRYRDAIDAGRDENITQGRIRL